jgi:hypothetical protein
MTGSRCPHSDAPPPSCAPARIEQPPGLLRIAVGQQFHGAFEIGKQHRDLLALALEGAFGGQDLLSKIGWV